MLLLAKASQASSWDEHVHTRSKVLYKLKVKECSYSHSTTVKKKKKNSGGVSVKATDSQQTEVNVEVIVPEQQVTVNGSITAIEAAEVLFDDTLTLVRQQQKV